MADQYLSRWVKFVAALALINLLVIGVWTMYEKQKTNQSLLSANQALQKKITQLEKEIISKKLQETTPETKNITEKTRRDFQLLEQEHASVQYYRSSIAEISSIKTMLSEAYMVEGKFPEGIENMITNLESYQTGAIRSLSVDTTIPRIKVQLQTLSGDLAGHYYVDAKINANSLTLSWVCRTFNDPLLQRALPECEFTSP